MADTVTQRDLLEQNTDLTRLIYEAVGSVSARVNDISDRLSHVEGKLSGEDDQESKQISRSSLGIYRAGILVSSVLSIAGLAISLSH